MISKAMYIASWYLLFKQAVSANLKLLALAKYSILFRTRYARPGALSFEELFWAQAAREKF